MASGINTESRYYRFVYFIKFAVALSITVILGINTTTYFNINANKDKYDNVTANNALALAWFNLIMAIITAFMSAYYLYMTIRGSGTQKAKETLGSYYEASRKYFSKPAFDPTTQSYKMM